MCEAARRGVGEVAIILQIVRALAVSIICHSQDRAIVHEPHDISISKQHRGRPFTLRMQPLPLSGAIGSGGGGGVEIRTPAASATARGYVWRHAVHLELWF